MESGVDFSPFETLAQSGFTRTSTSPLSGPVWRTLTENLYTETDHSVVLVNLIFFFLLFFLLEKNCFRENPGLPIYNSILYPIMQGISKGFRRERRGVILGK